MNKKLLFAAMSLAMLTACSNDDFESQKVAEGISPIQFEVVNGQDDAFTRASMSGNKIVWNANDGDLFTLYHGGAVGGNPFPLTGYSNATYKANANEGGTATLTTPSMINPGYAIMTWPVDTTFRAAGDLSIQINEIQGKDIENQIPYVSDLVDIQPRTDAAAYNEAGYNRTYPVYMRPMASQLIIKADYAGTDAAFKALEAGEDGIDPISVTSVELLTKNAGGTTDFTKKINLKFTAKDGTVTARWDAGEPNNKWSHVTGFDLASAVPATKLTTKCVTGNESAKFLILPQADIDVSAANKGVDEGAIVINTTYGKVVVAAPGIHESTYTAEEIADAWYRYQAPGSAAVALENATTIAGTGSDAGKVRYTNNIALGLAQVINAFSNNTTTKATSIVKDEPTGAVGTRYVKVLLSKLNIDGAHIKTDKQLYDVVRVWKEIGTGNVTVNLDGDDPTDADGKFEISQKTIAKINEINAALAGEGRSFSVKACETAGEVCKTIVITGGGNIPNLAFIVTNGGTDADVALAAEATWNWNGTTDEAKQVLVGTGVKSIINRGTINSAATATLATYDAAGVQKNLPFTNAKGANWNVTGKITVQFDVTNLGTVTISQNAQYRQGAWDNAGTPTASTFKNDAETLPGRFLADPTTEKIGTVDNSGVFATVSAGVINNYGLIEHRLANAKTYITTNQIGAGFGAAFNAATNKIGRINLPYEIRSSVDNASINNALNTGFVSLTITSGVATLKTSEIGKANYIIANGGVTKIEQLPAGAYLEIDQSGTEIVWNAAAAAYTLAGLVVFSDVNIKQGATVTVGTATYLSNKADMYVGGVFNPNSYTSYYGNTAANEAEHIITY